MELSKVYKLVWKRVETVADIISSLQDYWDVVLCDYNIPGLPTRVVLATIRNNFMQPYLPIIIISGIVDEDTVIELLKHGASDFISKEHPQRLALAIEREIQGARTRKGEALRHKVRLEEAFQATIAAWGKALELRDIHTQGHTQRVTDCALKFAVELGVDHKQFTDLHRGALLHDIGKMGIPDAILLKQDTLTTEEYNIMKMHPVLARDMLQDIPFLRDAIHVPYSHHERWNGSGYPLGLKGTEIPFLARLFGICDVYDALTSDRPYRKSWEKSRVIAYLLDERSHSFDPEMVDAFINMVGRQ
jgi:HD-GYP domain-containing protein (c-di-GMP phosphodiesterase class II)